MSALSELRRAALAYPAMLRTGLAGAIAYRAEMVVWMLTTTMPLVSLALWSAVAENGRVGRYSQRDFAVYFIAVLLVRQLTSSWVVWEMNYEIRQGVLAQRLMKPLHPLWYYSASNLGALPLRVVLCSPLVVLSVVLFDALPVPRTLVGASVLAVSLLGAWLVNFLVMSLVGSLAFFVESSLAIFDFYLFAFVLLSGYIVPLDLFPKAVQTATYYLPFRYSVAFPVEVATGALEGREMFRQLGIQWGFVVGLAASALIVFRMGVRRFAAFGG